MYLNGIFLLKKYLLNDGALCDEYIFPTCVLRKITLENTAFGGEKVSPSVRPWLNLPLFLASFFHLTRKSNPGAGGGRIRSSVVSYLAALRFRSRGIRFERESNPRL